MSATASSTAATSRTNFSALRNGTSTSRVSIVWQSYSSLVLAMKARNPQLTWRSGPVFPIRPWRQTTDRLANTAASVKSSVHCYVTKPMRSRAFPKTSCATAEKTVPKEKTKDIARQVSVYCLYFHFTANSCHSDYEKFTEINSASFVSAVARQPRTPRAGGQTIRRGPTLYIVLVS